MIVIKMNLGINDDTVRPYKDEISNCFRFGSISSMVTFNIIIAAISPIVKNQNKIVMTVFKVEDVSNCVIDCNQ